MREGVTQGSPSATHQWRSAVPGVLPVVLLTAYVPPVPWIRRFQWFCARAHTAGGRGGVGAQAAHTGNRGASRRTRRTVPAKRSDSSHAHEHSTAQQPSQVTYIIQDVPAKGEHKVGQTCAGEEERERGGAPDTSMNFPLVPCPVPSWVFGEAGGSFLRGFEQGTSHSGLMCMMAPIRDLSKQSPSQAGRKPPLSPLPAFMRRSRSGEGGLKD